MDTVRILSLNIWNRSGPWDARLPLICAGLATEAADVVGLQEVMCMQGPLGTLSQLDAIVDGLPQPGQLLIVGGDTLLAVCRATGAQALLAGASRRTGWGCATLVGGRWHGTCCHSRSGAFGDPDDLLNMLRLLTGDASTQILRKETK